MKKSKRIPKIKGSRRTSKTEIKNQKEFDKSCKYRVEWRFGSEWNQKSTYKYRYMECRECGKMDHAGTDASAITCWRCVNKMVDPPEIKAMAKRSGKPAGWHFMKEFVDKDGKVYHRGIEQPKLKGTLPPTKIQKKKRLNKRDKLKISQQAAAELYDLKKQLKRAKFKKDQRKIEVQIRKQQRLAAGKIPKNYTIDQ